MIKINNLIKKYDKVILDRISFDFPSSGVVAISGESGCGKSTLIKIIAGIDKDYSGNVMINNQKITKMSHSNNLIGLAMQKISFIRNTTVSFNLEILSKSYKEDCKEFINLLDLTFLLNQKIETLSKGEKSLVSLLRTLLYRPRILVLDEILSSLDENTGLKVLNYLKGLSTNTLIIIVTHQLEQYCNYFDTILILENGNIKLIKESDKCLDVPYFKEQKKKDIPFTKLGLHYFIKEIKFISLALFPLILGIVLILFFSLFNQGMKQYINQELLGDIDYPYIDIFREDKEEDITVPNVINSRKIPTFINQISVTFEGIPVQVGENIIINNKYNGDSVGIELSTTTLSKICSSLQNCKEIINLENKVIYYDNYNTQFKVNIADIIINDELEDILFINHQNPYFLIDYLSNQKVVSPKFFVQTLINFSPLYYDDITDYLNKRKIGLSPINNYKSSTFFSFLLYSKLDYSGESIYCSKTILCDEKLYLLINRSYYQIKIIEEEISENKIMLSQSLKNKVGFSITYKSEKSDRDYYKSKSETFTLQTIVKENIDDELVLASKEWLESFSNKIAIESNTKIFRIYTSVEEVDKIYSNLKEQKQSPYVESRGIFEKTSMNMKLIMNIVAYTFIALGLLMIIVIDQYFFVYNQKDYKLFLSLHYKRINLLKLFLIRGVFNVIFTIVGGIILTLFIAEFIGNMVDVGIDIPTFIPFDSVLFLFVFLFSFQFILSFWRYYQLQKICD